MAYIFEPRECLHWFIDELDVSISPGINGAGRSNEETVITKGNNMLFTVTLIKKPCHSEQLAGATESILLGQTQVIGENANAALVRLGAENADKLKEEDLARLSVVIVQLA